MDNFYNKFIGNIYSKTSTKSEVTSQILFGEKFTILNKNKDWFKIKTSFDNYIGFIKKSKFIKIHNPDFKIFSPKSPVFKKINNTIYCNFKNGSIKSKRIIFATNGFLKSLGIKVNYNFPIAFLSTIHFDLRFWVHSTQPYLLPVGRDMLHILHIVKLLHQVQDYKPYEFVFR